MQYKDSINIGGFMLFAFITIAIVVEIFRSGKANLIIWKSLLPKSETEVAFIYHVHCNYSKHI